MYAVLKEIVVPFSDLRYLTIECPSPGCRTQVLMDMALPVTTVADQPIPGTATPSVCPFCGTALNVSRLVDSYRNVFQSLSDLGTKLNFRIKDNAG
jgi:hypothetical protein